MNAPGLPAASLPRWLPWLLLGLLVLPFHPLWIDFEQVRRGLLLVLAGACLVLLPGLPRCRGGRAAAWFLAALCASAIANCAWQWLSSSDEAPMTFQPWDAAYRLAHWLALGVMLRAGAAAPAAFGSPLAAVLLATSAFGLLQRLGIAAIGAYGLPHEPVSTLGNLNVASEWTAVAAAAVAVATQHGWLRITSLVVASAYLVVDQSRSGLVALPIGLVLAGLLQRARGWHTLLWSLLGAAIGTTILLLGPHPPDRGEPEAVAARTRAVATLQVRAEIAKGCASLFAESPLLGQGPGQFQVQYPRVRTANEIELSSDRRGFATEVRTAHDDWLEVLVEGGAPALLLLVWSLWALRRGAADAARLVPLAVLLLLMFARSPLWNAPAAVAAALLAGTAAAATTPAPRPRRLPRLVLGTALVALGALPLAAYTLALPWLAAAAAGKLPPADEGEAAGPLQSAAAWMPFEPRWKQLLAQEQMRVGNLAGAATTAARAIQLRPFDPQLYVLLAEILARGSRFAEAASMARHALAFDPPNPELRVLLSTVLAQRGVIDDAILAVVETPHEKLRARLADHFAGLAALAARAGDEVGARRFRVEQAFVRAVDGLGDRSPGGLAATGEQVRELLQALSAAERQKLDLRGLVISALHALDLGDASTAELIGAQAVLLDVPFPEWQRALLGEALEPLQHVPSWRPVLQR